MFSLSAERLLSMSAFEAAQVLRGFRLRNPGLLDRDAVTALRAVRADLYALDYEAGLILEAAIPALPDYAPRLFFRACIDFIITSASPLWTRIAPGGREQVMRAVPLNGVQCFRAAGLLEIPPDAATWLWWDNLASQARADRDAALLEQGRKAEWWSYQRELTLLSEMGIQRHPIWAAIEDNRLGYDILSYRRDGPSEVNRLIEVKSSTLHPPRIVLTRNEWLTAANFGDAIEFHLWTIPSRELHIISYAEMRRHIPADREAGEWTEVEITPTLRV